LYHVEIEEVHSGISRITILSKIDIPSGILSGIYILTFYLDAVVTEWQSSCEIHGFAILFQILRSVLTLPAT